MMRVMRRDALHDYYATDKTMTLRRTRRRHCGGADAAAGD
eukprot:SAG22_NODE_11040_length_503_cov_1.925743_1_plen_39_part_01